LVWWSGKPNRSVCSDKVSWFTHFQAEAHHKLGQLVAQQALAACVRKNGFAVMPHALPCLQLANEDDRLLR
jgi:hypothetical protein